MRPRSGLAWPEYPRLGEVIRGLHGVEARNAHQSMRIERKNLAQERKEGKRALAFGLQLSRQEGLIDKQGPHRGVHGPNRPQPYDHQPLTALAWTRRARAPIKRCVRSVPSNGCRDVPSSRPSRRRPSASGPRPRSTPRDTFSWLPACAAILHQHKKDELASSLSCRRRAREQGRRCRQSGRARENI